MSAARTPDGAGRARGLVILAISVIALGLIALGVHAMGQDRGDPITTTTITPSAARTVTGPPLGEAEWSTPSERPRPQGADLTGIGRIIGTVIAVIGTIALVLLLIWILRRSRWFLHRGAEGADEYDETQDEESLSSRAAADALGSAARSLESTGDPDAAIIAAWMALERAVAASGIRREPSETTLEHVRRVLGALPLDARDLQDFADLFRRARFGGAPMTEADRERAAALLAALRAQLESAEAGGLR